MSRGAQNTFFNTKSDDYTNFSREKSRNHMGITTFREKHYLSFTWGFKKSNNTTRNQNYGDFKSVSILGERKPKKLIIVSTLLIKDIALV